MSTTRYDPGTDAPSGGSAWAEIFGESNNREQQQRLLRNLQRAMEQELTPRQHQIVELYYGHGLPVTRIGEALGVTPSTVSRTLRRAKDRLRRYLEYSL